MDSYTTLDQANAFHAVRPTFAAWNALSDSDKMARLVAASDVVDSLRFRGAKSDPNQLRQFPRGGVAYVPTAVVQAVAYLAGNPQCLGAIGGSQSKQLSSVKIGELQVNYQSGSDTTAQSECMTFLRGLLADWLLPEKRMGAILVGGRGCGCGA